MGNSCAEPLLVTVRYWINFCLRNTPCVWGFSECLWTIPALEKLGDGICALDRHTQICGGEKKTFRPIGVYPQYDCNMNLLMNQRLMMGFNR